MRSVPDIGIPADALFGCPRTGSHLMIADAGPMKGGTLITLTLIFAKGGTMSVHGRCHQPGERRQRLLPELTSPSNPVGHELPPGLTQRPR